MMRKAQIEIMGLVVVVVLVVIGMFFSLTLKTPTNTRPVSQVYGDEKLASDFLITFLETTEPTCEKTMRDIVIDCIKQRTLGVSRLLCGGEESCSFINSTLYNITSQTLDPWGISYTITFSHVQGGETNEIVRVDHTGCNDGKEVSAPGVQPIPLYGTAPGTAVMRLEICT